MKLKVSEIIDAIEKNGYPQIRREYVAEGYDEKTNDRVVTGACAIGQGALNLKVPYYILKVVLDQVRANRKDLAPLGTAIIYQNDNQRKTIPEIVEYVRARYSK